ncbi:hypothetical protein [Alteromonas sp. 14N.309.X.WAT.G.H12]|uniref:hypothetical protein n=1 Tax=Alteromonas sp. 14N.309.X.WAT.G.H12 TaxID=3120824 RepID=UPI002FD5A147
MDDFYARKPCKGMCLQIDIGVCMGVCGTDDDYAQRVYDAHKLNAKNKGLPWEPIPDFEKSLPQHELGIPIENTRSNGVRR